MTQQEFDSLHYIEVALPTPLPRHFTYKSAFSVPVGCRVRVPFGKSNRALIGVVMADSQQSPESDYEIKTLIEVLDPEPEFSPALLIMAKWLSNYYMVALGEVLRAMLPVTPPKAKKASSVERSASQWLPGPTLALTPIQERAFAALTENWQPPSLEFRPFLLWGVTGAGKTEIYLQLIAKARQLDPQAQVLVLVPEISLTPQMTQVFSSRFPEQVAVVHSQLTNNQRWEQLQRVRHGQAAILIGPRSAVFANFKALRLIIVDEEHDSSYKQTTGFSYNGRDVAVVRAQQEKIAIVLGSATPSAESYYNAKTGKYGFIKIDERVAGRPLPTIHLVEQSYPKQKGLALKSNKDPLPASLPFHTEMTDALERVISKGQQAMVILNRRGFAYFLYSRLEKKAIQCPHCSVTLTLHKRSRHLHCHYCEHRSSLESVLAKRPDDDLVAVGFGSEQAEAYLETHFSKVGLARVDSDSVSKKDSLATILADFRSGKTKILVGTQILAKGHDFSGLTLICILEVDQLLNLPDFRAGERAFQLLVQASGRAGRHELAGDVYIQCQRQDHPVIQAAIRQDYLGFMERELAFREIHGYPPFGRMIYFEINGRRKDRVEKAEQALGDFIESSLRQQPELGQGMMILGPSRPPIELLRGRHRRSLLICSANMEKLRRLARSIASFCQTLPRELRYKLDVDPQTLL